MRAFLLGVSLAVAGCGSAGHDPAPTSEPARDTNGTTPAPSSSASAPAQEDDTPAPPSPISFSPACGTDGQRVVLRLGLTKKGSVPTCVEPDDFRVRFGNMPTRITQSGLTSDGYCSLDVLVPEHAETAMVSVTSGKDEFASAIAFSVPCP